MLLIAVLFSLLPGPTFELPPTTCAGELPAGQSRAEWEATVSQPALSPALPGGTDDWVLADSVHLGGELAPGRRIVFGVDDWWGYPLDTIVAPAVLPAECRQALDHSPAWLEPRLSSAFRRLGDSAAVAYAELLLAVPEPYIDEVGFCIATMGPEILTHWTFNPDLLLLNAQQLYQIDDSLAFADIVERGAGPDAYSTVRYAVLDRQDTAWVELPPEIYYYYVVHPVTSDEIPRLDDYVYNKHWREYFFFEADSGFPVLGDHVKQARIVWRRIEEVFPSGRPFLPEDCALDVIGNWLTRTNVAGASGNRPIHPNVIAHEHNGNCGEVQDLWTAACRTCLIPVVNCSDPCEDHVWNEFWDGYWLPLASDPSTRIADSGCAYEEAHGGSKRISGVFNWRPDGFWWTVTGHYSNACSLYVRTLDALGRPFDGARVLVSSEGWYGGLSTSTIGCTDARGAVAFELGDLRNFYVQVQTPFGTWPDANSSVRVVSTSQTGARYFSTLYLPWTIPAPRPRPEPYEPVEGYARVAVRLNVAAELNSGFSVSRGAGTGDPDDSVRFYRYYADQVPGGTIDFFVLDTAAYRRYDSDERFSSPLFLDDAPAPQSRVFHPQPPWWPEPARFVISAEDKLATSRWLDSDILYYVNPPGVAGDAPPAQPGLGLPAVVRGPVSIAAEGTELVIFDACGRVAARAITGAAGPEYRGSLAPGVYLARLYRPAAPPLTRRFVVVR